MIWGHNYVAFYAGDVFVGSRAGWLCANDAAGADDGAG